MELIQQYSTPIRSVEGVSYVVRSIGEQRSGGAWSGSLLFDPIGGAGDALCSSQETSQPNREELQSWASGLDTRDFEAALKRACVVG